VWRKEEEEEEEQWFNEFGNALDRVRQEEQFKGGLPDLEEENLVTQRRVTATVTSGQAGQAALPAFERPWEWPGSSSLRPQASRVLSLTSGLEDEDVEGEEVTNRHVTPQESTPESTPEDGVENGQDEEDEEDDDEMASTEDESSSQPSTAHQPSSSKPAEHKEEMNSNSRLLKTTGRDCKNELKHTVREAR